MSEVNQPNISAQDEVVGQGGKAGEVQGGGGEAALEVVGKLVQERAQRHPFVPLGCGISGGGGGHVFVWGVL